MLHEGGWLPPVPAGGSRGFSGFTVGGVNAGAPVQAAERQRQVSMPTGAFGSGRAIIGPPVNAGTGGDKWNPYTDEGRIHQALLGNEPPWQDPLAPYGPAMASIGVSFIPGLNSYMVLNDPEASTASKALAVGSDVLSVVGVGTVLKLGAKGAGLAKGLIVGTEAVEESLLPRENWQPLGCRHTTSFRRRPSLRQCGKRPASISNTSVSSSCQKPTWVNYTAPQVFHMSDLAACGTRHGAFTSLRKRRQVVL